jgi:hypothetical protein
MPVGGRVFATVDDLTAKVRAVLDMLVQLHRARVGVPRADDFVVPHLDLLPQMMREPREAWRGGS